MAEFPDLGEHCSLALCNKLEFMPFKCRSCSNFYCFSHRFTHGCAKDSAELDESESDSNVMKKQFLCSFTRCFNYEFIRIECSLCNKVFCIRHRQCEDHNCEKLRVADMPSAKPSDIVDLPTSLSQIQPSERLKKLKAKLDPIQRARLDRVALIKAKMTNPLKLPAEEQFFVFVSVINNDAEEVNRQLLMISRNWSIGKSTDTIWKQLKLDEIIKRWDMFKVNKNGEELDEPLPPADAVTKHLTTECDICLMPQR